MASRPMAAASKATARSCRAECCTSTQATAASLATQGTFCSHSESTDQMKPRIALIAFIVAACASTASAQLLAAKDGPIVYGHHHIAASDIPAHLKFFADTLGGTRIKFGPQQVDVVKFPNVFIFFRNQKPTGGSKGTTVNHVGFSVPNLRATLDRVKAGGY